MRSLYLFLMILCAKALFGAPLIYITELLRDPYGLESAIGGGASHEFIEIFNAGQDTFWLNNVFVTDGVEADSVIPFGIDLPKHSPSCKSHDAFLPPGAVGIILDQDYATASVTTLFSIDTNTFLFTVDDHDLGNSLSTDDGVALYMGTRRTVDSVAASVCDGSQAITPSGGKLVCVAKSSEGVSVVAGEYLFGSPQYAACPTGVSLGKVEDRTGFWLVQKHFGKIDQLRGTLACTLALMHTGSTIWLNVRWELDNSVNGQSVQGGTLLAPKNPSQIIVHIPCNGIATATNLVLNSDQETQLIPIGISEIWVAPRSLMINELFPRATTSIPEWFELINRTTATIDIRGWYFGNAEDKRVLSERSNTILPGEYLIVTADSALFLSAHPSCRRICVPPSWHTLDNYHDTLIVSTASQIPVDTAAWNSSWFDVWDRGSLEKVSIEASGIARSSWARSERSSPGQPNVALSIYSQSAIRLEAGPIPFTPNNDNVNDLCIISVICPPTYSTAVSIWGFDGTKYCDLAMPPTQQLFWNGKRADGSNAPVGPFFVVVQLTNKEDGGKKQLRQKGVLWR